MKMVNSVTSTGALFVFAAFLLGGCTTNKVSEPPRTATEQLLLSTAADHALQSAMPPGMFANRKVFLDAAYFDSYDPKYVIGAVRDALSRSGALLENTATDSDIIVEIRSGALSIDTSDTFFGVPSIPVPIPLTTTLTTPEVPIYKSHTERSVAKFALLALARGSRAHIYSSGPLDGKAYEKSHLLFFVSWARTDVPEKHKQGKRSEQYQTWFPQSDPANLPATNRPAIK